MHFDRIKKREISRFFVFLRKVSEILLRKGIPTIKMFFLQNVFYHFLKIMV